MNVFQILEESARRYSRQIALVDELGEVTFKELLALAAEVQEQLQKLGVTPGVGVGIQPQRNRHQTDHPRPETGWG